MQISPRVEKGLLCVERESIEERRRKYERRESSEMNKIICFASSGARTAFGTGLNFLFFYYAFLNSLLLIFKFFIFYFSSILFNFFFKW
jgi:hypothetical protein